MQRDILAALKAKDEAGVTPQWIGQALELLLRAELARQAAAADRAAPGR